VLRDSKIADDVANNESNNLYCGTAI